MPAINLTYLPAAGVSLSIKLLVMCLEIQRKQPGYSISIQKYGHPDLICPTKMIPDKKTTPGVNLAIYIPGL